MNNAKWKSYGLKERKKERKKEDNENRKCKQFFLKSIQENLETRANGTSVGCVHHVVCFFMRLQPLLCMSAILRHWFWCVYY